ncbi:perlucin-like [Anastrepha ludens]|uniref:perlucin-like n=1 Tax=Anastrepha ludens TaxID=28586 RepID=UPI0023B15890|nr:perlucin-like [Anastrepha ludens]
MNLHTLECWNGNTVQHLFVTLKQTESGEIAYKITNKSCPGTKSESAFKLSWWAARDFCTERQMKLVSLQTEEKSKQLNDFLQAHNLVDSPELGNDFIYWTSGTDQKHDGKFVWNGAENEEFTFTNWLPGMPDNWRGDEHCVEIGFKELGKWNDNRCRYHRHFICEVSHLVNAGIVKDI